MYYVSFYYLLKGYNHPIVHRSNPYSIQNINLWIKINKKPYKLLSKKYNGCKELLSLLCLNNQCKERFETTWEILKQGCSCPFCSGQKVSFSNCLAIKNPNLAKEWHPTKNINLTPYDVTCGSGKKVWWQCSKNPKHEWMAEIVNRNKSGCPYCAGRLPSEEYNLAIYYPELCKDWNYQKNEKPPSEYTPGSQKIVWWKCNKCGEEWKGSISNAVWGRGCPKCFKSYGERIIDRYLKEKEMFFEYEFSFDDLLSESGYPLRFDFAVFEDMNKTKIKTLIEFDGMQHYKWVKGFFTEEAFNKLQFHDKLKNEYCNNNNIKLLRIPYWEVNNINSILEKELSN